MDASQLDLDAWDAWGAALPGARAVAAAQLGAAAEISVAPAPGVQERDALAHLLKRLVATASQVLCTPAADPFEERSCVAVAQQAEARTESASAQAVLSLKKARENSEVVLGVTEALIEAAVA
jgi:hypothetical protein